MVDLDACRLGDSAKTIAFSSAAENRTIANTMAAQARRTLYLFTSDLDPLIYDRTEFVEAAASMARGYRRARIHVLVQDSSRAAAEGHRLVQLAQRLSSRVELRKPSPDHADLMENFLLADGVGLIRRLIPSRYDGIASFHDPLQARELTSRFEEVWERALPDRQLRRLHL